MRPGVSLKRVVGANERLGYGATFHKNAMSQMFEQQGAAMKKGFFSIQYSFLCPNVKCHGQFEESLLHLIKVDTVGCPRCRTTIDIRESKQSGDLGRTFRDVQIFEETRRGPADG